MKRLLRRMLDETEFLCRLRRALPVARPRATSVYVSTATAWTHACATSPASRTPACSAATPTGAARSGSRSTTCIIESLQKFHHYYGDDFKVECPTGSGHFLTLEEVADELARRLTRIFLRGRERPAARSWHTTPSCSSDPHFRDYVLFYEYFHGDTGRGVGASHQTGWTGLVAKLLMPRYARELPRPFEPG